MKIDDKQLGNPNFEKVNKNDLHQLLIELEEYFDNKADADWDGDTERHIPNKAMQFQMEISKILDSIK